MSDIPAGWYDDPEQPAQYRYWDGAQWTDHRAPKSAPPAAAGEGVWAIVPEAFRLLGAGWRPLVVLALPMLVLTLVAGSLAYTALDGALDPSLADIIDRASEPGFDPFDDPADEAFVESIELSIDGAVIAATIAAGLLLLIAWLVTSVAFTVLLVAIRSGRTPSVSETYAIVLPRLPRVLGIMVLWWVVSAVVVFAAVFVMVVLAVITPLTLLLTIPALLAATIYAYPFAMLAPTALAVAPTDDPPLRRVIALVRPQWGAIAVRVLVVTLTMWAIGFATGIVTAPFSSAGLATSLLLSAVLQIPQAAFTSAGWAALYGFAGGPVGPDVTEPTT